MNANEFEFKLLEGLKKLSDNDIKKLRQEFNSEGEYGIDEYGTSYWIPSEVNIDIDYSYKPMYNYKKFELISNDAVLTQNTTSLKTKANKDNFKIEVKGITQKSTENINIVAA